MLVQPINSSKVVLYLQQELKIKDMTLPIQDIACLDNQTCVILSSHQFLILDLRHPEAGEIKKGHLVQRGMKIHPLVNRFCVQARNQLVVFNGLGQEIQVIDIQESERQRVDEILVRISHPEWSFRINWNRERFIFADESQLIATSFQPGSVKLLNLRTGKRDQLVISFNDRINKVYMDDATHGICVRRLDGSCSLWMVEFVMDGECRELKNVGNHSFLRLNKLHRGKKLLLLSNYSHVFLYNYQEQRVIMQWSLFYSQIANKVCSDFNNIVSITKKQKKEISITHHRGMPNRRKIIMKLIQDSHIGSLYPGDGLIRRVLQITDV